MTMIEARKERFLAEVQKGIDFYKDREVDVEGYAGMLRHFNGQRWSLEELWELYRDWYDWLPVEGGSNISVPAFLRWLSEVRG